MNGKIIKGIAGFYYVDVVESGVYECKAKGAFRREKVKPLVGDNVEIEVLDEKDREGNITKILPRKNELIRPAARRLMWIRLWSYLRWQSRILIFIFWTVFWS